MLFAAIIILFVSLLILTPFLIIGRNASKVKRRLPRWTSNETLIFGRSLGSFGASRKQFWGLGKYSDIETRIIAKYQYFTLAEIAIAWILLCVFFYCLLVSLD